MIRNNLVNRGSMPHYYIWFQYGDSYGGNEASSRSNFKVVNNIEESIHMYTETS